MSKLRRPLSRPAHIAVSVAAPAVPSETSKIVSTSRVRCSPVPMPLASEYTVTSSRLLQSLVVHWTYVPFLKSDGSVALTCNCAMICSRDGRTPPSTKTGVELTAAGHMHVSPCTHHAPLKHKVTVCLMLLVKILLKVQLNA
jgi:hypothetical protein